VEVTSTLLYVSTSCGYGPSSHFYIQVTLALATYRGFPWRKVPGYILAQVLGGLTGAALVYANYYQAIVSVVSTILLSLLNNEL
jgi:glycerol uptake facilitator-like aquaporin